MIVSSIDPVDLLEDDIHACRDKAGLGLDYILSQVHAKRNEEKPGLVVMSPVLVDDGDLPFLPWKQFPHLVGHDSATGAGTENQQLFHK
jgi:hypothetical protein